MGVQTNNQAASWATAEKSVRIDSNPNSVICNIARHLPRMAALVPKQNAVVVTSRRDQSGKAIYEALNFAEMEALSNRYASGLAAYGFTRGQRVLMMVRPGFDFIALTFALFKLGAVPVLIDPGMGIGRMLDCIRSVDVQGFIGIPLAQVMRVLRPGSFGKVTHCVTVGRRFGWGGLTLKEIGARGSERFELVDTRADEMAAILFTSGSTGPAKGVVYAHGMFDAQVRMIQSHYGILPGEVDLPALPVFALFSTAMGMTCVIPDMDPSRPARVNPALIVEAIQDQQVTNTFGSPAIWKRVVPYCQQNGIKLTSLMRVLVAGCAVPPKLIEQLRELLSEDADVHTPYGATEALPICSIAGKELFTCGTGFQSVNRAAGFSLRDDAKVGPASDSLNDIARAEARGSGRVAWPSAGSNATAAPPCTAVSLSDASPLGFGICVGHPLPSIEIRIIRITDEPLALWSADLLVPDGDYGEIVVAGPVVTRAYFNQPSADAVSKIKDGGATWHRMGDIGYLDADGRVWFCGRKSQRVTLSNGVLFADQCEAVFSTHPRVARSALVGVPLKSTFDNRQSTIPRFERSPDRVSDPPLPHGRGSERFWPFDSQSPISNLESRIHLIPVLIVEPVHGPFRRRSRQGSFAEELLTLARANPLTRDIQHVLFHPSLPVDVRHNAKINREALAQWAAKRIGSKRS